MRPEGMNETTRRRKVGQRLTDCQTFKYICLHSTTYILSLLPVHFHIFHLAALSGMNVFVRFLIL